MTVIDLFCGAGGFSEGFKQAGFDIILAIDNWKTALDSHRINHPKSNHWLVDITRLNSIPECDVVIASPPCVDFSVANRSTTKNTGRGLEMIKKTLELIVLSRCKYWVLENVWGLEKHYGELRKGLCVPPDVKFATEKPHIKIDCYDYGAKCHRKRLFIGNFPKPSPKLPFQSPYPTITAQGGGGQWGNCKAWKAKGLKNYSLDYDLMLDVMGFPPNYVIIGGKADIKKQVGNAVCPPTAKAIATAIWGDWEKK